MMSLPCWSPTFKRALCISNQIHHYGHPAMTEQERMRNVPIGWGASHQPMRGTVLRRWDRILQPSVGIRHVWLDFPVAVKHALRVHMYSPSQKRAGTTFSSFWSWFLSHVTQRHKHLRSRAGGKRKLLVQQAPLPAFVSSWLQEVGTYLHTCPGSHPQVDSPSPVPERPPPKFVRPSTTPACYGHCISTGLFLRFLAGILVMF